ncbi:leucine-rich repeat and WD repeat-containing protein 1 [Ahaetulla prasina]|uniref:leucine-rich repeat and WD repeat-containing protein 1 n=1 Tax=Ahaetulla prasina TaxID=499056 RepID=UPI002647D29E|nr:leucine-rich repeat and WD repeat-containing protein 1 [Ahaetulla prasina]XP_058020342.1 leucine-rich repeat and WD repeat-containing protein 1 [Ahaetulla prasina]XP_058020343.1 leucine-rich repeat and WD repeat-containing protein 1 [Ahaetulla prasina]
MSKITTELLLERAVPKSTRLRKIKTLNLSKLQITTEDLEPQLFSHLRHLQELDLSDNLLERLPDNLSLPNLRILNCNNNHLEDVTALQQFPQLEELTYTNNVYLTPSDDYKVIFLLQNLRQLNGKDITKLANHVRVVNSRELTNRVSAHWGKKFRNQMPKTLSSEQLKPIKKKFIRSAQAHVAYGPSSLADFTRWRVKMIAEQFLTSLINEEHKPATEAAAESTDEQEEEEEEEEEEKEEEEEEEKEEIKKNTADADNKVTAKGPVTPSKRKGARSKGRAKSKRSHSQSSSKEEASPSPKKLSRLQDEPSTEATRASRPQAKESQTAPDPDGAHRNGGRLPKAQSHKKVTHQKEEHKEEEDERDVCSTPVKDLECEEAITLEPVHFLQCHSKANNRDDFKTQLWACVFEPPLDCGTRKDPVVSSSRTAATCGGDSVCLVDCETGIVLKKYKVTGEEFYTVAWTTLTMVTSDGRKKKHNVLAAAGRRGIVKLIHVTADYCYGEIKAHKKPIATACFSPTCETHLFTASYDKKICAWDIGIPDCDYNFQERQLMVLETISTPLRIALVPSCPDRFLVAGCEQGCFAWDIRLDDKPQKNRTFEVEFQFPDDEGNDTSSHRVDGLAFLNEDIVVTKSSKRASINLWSWSRSFKQGKSGRRTVQAVILAELEWSSTDLPYLTLSTCPTEEYVFCGDEKGSIWMYDLSNHLSALCATKEDCPTERIGPSQILKWPELKANGELLTDVLVNNVVTDPTFTYLVALTDVNIAAIWKKV